jgi:hypothetical protein
MLSRTGQQLLREVGKDHDNRPAPQLHQPKLDVS